MRTRRGTLIERLDVTMTPLGARRLARFLAYPLLDAARIGARQDAVAWLFDRDRLRASPFDEVAPGLQLTFSAGVTGCLGQGDIDSAIERADQAMYRAKEAGRDRTEAS